MNKLFALLFILFSIHAKSQTNLYRLCEYSICDSEYLSDKEYYIFTDSIDVKLNLLDTASIIDHLYIGQKIYILNETEKLQTVNGIQSPWYKIAFIKNAQQTLVGYVWGGYITNELIKSPTSNCYFLYGPTKVINAQKSNLQKFYFSVKALHTKKKLSEIELNLMGSLGTKKTMRSVGDKGVSGIKEVLYINFGDQYCGGACGNAILFWSGEKIYHPITLNCGADGSYFYDEEIIYPKDKNGKSGKLFIEKKEGYNNQVEKYKKEVYIWTGKVLKRQ